MALSKKIEQIMYIYQQRFNIFSKRIETRKDIKSLKKCSPDKRYLHCNITKKYFYFNIYIYIN